MNIRPIQDALGGEQVVGVVPTPTPAVDAGWRRRLNLYTGRSLTDVALTTEQSERAGRLATHGQAVSPGVVVGLDIGVETVTTDLGHESLLHISPGTGLTMAGEDVVVPRPMRIALRDVRVYAPVSLLTPPTNGGVEAPAPGFLAPRTLGPPLHAVAQPGALPVIAVLLLQPVSVEMSGVHSSTDPCDSDPGSEAFDDWQLVDGCRPVLYPWPEEWLPLPLLGQGDRNRLANTIFEAERRSERGRLPDWVQQGLEHPQAWPPFDRPTTTLPWLDVGVPIALLSCDAFSAGTHVCNWVDRSSVVRQGGRGREIRPWLPNTGTPAVWQARMQQFAEHMADPQFAQAEIGAIAQELRYLPPVGLLPRDAFDPHTGQSSFFPASFASSVRPVPLEQLDTVVESSASLAPFDLMTADQIELLVPVPQVWYTPDLLREETVDSSFQHAIDVLSTDRWNWLQRRDDVRGKASAIEQAVSGTPISYPTPDPDRLDDESIVPTTPYAASQVHFATALTGGHDYRFLALTPLSVAAGDVLFTYAYIDPDNPPGSIALAWSPDGSDWNHVAYWGAGPQLTVDQTITPQHMGATPPAGTWVRLEVPAALLNLVGASITQIRFITSEGGVAWGRSGTSTPQQAGTATDVSWIDGPASIHPLEAMIPPWTWSELVTQPLPLEDAYQTQPTPSGPQVTPIADLQQALSNTLPYEDASVIDQQGLQAFITQLQSKADIADDRIDFSFTRVHTDIYRIRQLMLGQVEGTRLATSPALATIARGASAAAVRDDLQTFWKNATTSSKIPPEPPISSIPRRTGGVQVLPEAMTAVPTETDGPVGPDGGQTTAGGAIGNGSVRSKRSAAERFLAGSKSFNSHFSSSITASEMTRNVSLPTAELMSQRGTASAAQQSVFVPAISDVSQKVQLAVAFQPSFPISTAVAPQTLVGLTASTGLGTDISRARLITAVADEGAPSLYSPAPSTSHDVIQQSPIVGAVHEFRTVSIVERMQDPQAPEAKTFAAASKYEIVTGLQQISQQGGIQLKDLTVPGVAMRESEDPPAGGAAAGASQRWAFDSFGQPKRKSIQFQDLDGDNLDRILNDPDPLNADESGFFAAGLVHLDDTIAFLRGIEGRVQAYRNAITLCQQTLATLQSLQPQADARLAEIDGHLTEARHNLSIARSLLADEQARVSDTNTRRATIVAQHVSFLAYRRPRISQLLTSAPSRELDPGLMEAPVPACLNQDVTVPPELRTLIDLLREAPVRWYPHIPILMERLNQLDVLQTAFQSAKLRASMFDLVQPVSRLSMAAPTLLGGAISSVLTAQRQVVSGYRRQTADFDLAGLGSGSWQQLRLQALDVLSLGDLIDGRHGRSDVAQLSAAEIDNIARVAGCLYGLVGTVLPAIRLLWAERLSEYQASVNLRNLSSLPRWREIDGADRREMQGLVDWLYQRIDSLQADAVSIMNDVVRVCILLASHAPVNQIISGDVAQATVVQVGGQVTINVDPVRVSVGSSVLMYHGNRVIARGVVEDLTAGKAATRILATADTTVQLDRGARVQFDRSDVFTRSAAGVGRSVL